MMEIVRLGLISVTQLKKQLLKRIQVVLEPIMVQRLRDPSQVLVLSAKDSLKRNQRAMSNMMVIVKLGLISVTQLNQPLLKRIQVELEPMIKNKRAHSQVSVLSAKDLLKLRKMMLHSHLEATMPGQKNVTQLRTLSPKRTQMVPVLTKMQIRDLSQV